MLFPYPNKCIVDEQNSPSSISALARTWKALLNVSVVLVLVVLASLIGVGGASLFIYRQMSNNVAVAKSDNLRGRATTLNADITRESQAKLLPGEAVDAQHATTPTVADSTEWHFAEFSDKPRYIDVTYDGGRQHARLKVNTVLSPELDATSTSSVGDVGSDDSETTSVPSTLSDPGAHYILDNNGRVVGVDGSAGAAAEARRSQTSAPTIQNPVPEVRVATPVLQYGRPLFDDGHPVQAAIPASPQYLPTRRALPVDGATSQTGAPFNADAELADDGQPVRPASPVTPTPRNPQSDRTFQLPDSTSVFERNR